MPEVIDIWTADAGPHDERGLDNEDRASAPARRAVIVAVVAVLLVFAVAYGVWGRAGGRTSAPRTAQPARAQVVAVASSALEAWGRFAVSGRLDEVAPYFDPAGPQFARFRQEAPDIAAHPAGPPAYRFAMSDASAEQAGSDWVVHGPVVVSRPGEADQHFAWELVVRRRGDAWVVWTVRESSGAAAGTVGGRP